MSSKDKRTKGQILRLLDNALTHEELLAEKIKTLETELADCRKKADDPRHEITEEAMPASKVSFRIDYYRTSEESPLKGIIEHLPSRQNKPFEGEWQLIINDFMSRFLNEETGKDKKKMTSAEEKIQPEPVPVESEKKKIVMQANAPQQEEVITSGSRLLQRLKTEFNAQSQAVNNLPVKMPVAKPAMTLPPSPPGAARIERRMSKVAATQTIPQMKKPMAQPVPSNDNKTQDPVRRSRILERIREEQRQKFKL